MTSPLVVLWKSYSARETHAERDLPCSGRKVQSRSPLCSHLHAGADWKQENVSLAWCVLCSSPTAYWKGLRSASSVLPSLCPSSAPSYHPLSHFYLSLSLSLSLFSLSVALLLRSLLLSPSPLYLSVFSPSFPYRSVVGQFIGLLTLAGTCPHCPSPDPRLCYATSHAWRRALVALFKSLKLKPVIQLKGLIVHTQMNDQNIRFTLMSDKYMTNDIVSYNSAGYSVCSLGETFDRQTSDKAKRLRQDYRPEAGSCSLGWGLSSPLQ